MNSSEMKVMIASRAGKGFFKSYVKNVKCVATRPVEGHVMGAIEYDYSFTYKGKLYRVNEHIVPNKEGKVIYSAKFRYELEEV